MSVHITPASEEDARVIAAQLESGICPWPGYEMIALTGQPWTFVLPPQAAGELLSRLYASDLAAFSATNGSGDVIALADPAREQQPPDESGTAGGDDVGEPQADEGADHRLAAAESALPPPQPQVQQAPEPQAAPQPTPARGRAKGRGKTGSTQTNVK